MGMRNRLGIKFVALALSALSLAACEKNTGTSTVTSRGGFTGPRSAMGYNNQNISVGGMQLQGVVYADASQQQGFQTAAEDFLSTDVRPQYIGYVSATGQYNSGIKFGGQVALAQGNLNTLNGGQAPVAPNSRFFIQVIDYLPQSPNSPLIPPFGFMQAQGYISGYQAQISFGDNYGSVTLNGTLNPQNSRFEGTMSFDNNVNVDSTQPAHAGTLGNFSIPVCQFFVCN